MTDNFQIYQLILLCRVVVAGICGSVIGLERSNRSKSAGVRTHCIVAIGAALMMVISKYGFSDTPTGEIGMRGADGARIAAQVVSGIGFLGAGMIFVHKNSITGLTTAAGIWATSGIGLAIGAGMYVLGILSMLTIMAAQVVFHKNFSWLKTPGLKTIYIDNVDEDNYLSLISKQLIGLGVNPVDTLADKNAVTGLKNYKITVEIPDDTDEDRILDMIKYNCKIKNT